MTITDFITVLGSVAGVALLAVMATVPLLLDLPLGRPEPATRAEPVAPAIPQQRGPTTTTRSAPDRSRTAGASTGLRRYLPRPGGAVTRSPA